MNSILVSRLATVPGLVRPGISHWNLKTRLPLHPLSVQNAYGDPRLLLDLAEPGATFVERLGVEVMVAAETGGIPLAVAVARIAGLPFAFVRKPGYDGHAPMVRGADVAGRRVLLVNDAISSGTALEAFAGQLHDAGATVLGAFTVVDLREVAAAVTPNGKRLPIESVATYRQVLTAARDNGVLDPTVQNLCVDALLNHWTDDDLLETNAA